MRRQAPAPPEVAHMRRQNYPVIAEAMGMCQNRSPHGPCAVAMRVAWLDFVLRAGVHGREQRQKGVAEPGPLRRHLLCSCRLDGAGRDQTRRHRADSIIA